MAGACALDERFPEAVMPHTLTCVNLYAKHLQGVATGLNASDKSDLPAMPIDRAGQPLPFKASGYCYSVASRPRQGKSGVGTKEFIPEKRVSPIGISQCFGRRDLAFFEVG